MAHPVQANRDRGPRANGNPQPPAPEQKPPTAWVIIEVDGKAVLNHAQLLHAMGPKYEGDTITVKVKRDKEEKTFANLVLGGSLTFTTPALTKNRSPPVW